MDQRVPGQYIFTLSFHGVPAFPNTTHEKGFRPGTVNVPGIAAMTVAAQKSRCNARKKSSS